MTLRIAPLAACLALLAATPALPGGTPDPDWPCVQRRQPALSVAQVWAGPPPDDAATAHARDADIQRLASVVALRRTALPEAEAMISEFAVGRNAATMTALFITTFDHIQTARNRVMSAITRYAHKQEALEARIEADRKEFARLSAAEPQDFDAIDRLEEQIDWSTRIFQDRQQSLTYVCETPVILEQRAFALGRAIAGAIKP